MSKYHIPVKGTRVGAGGFARCGARRIDRYKVVTVSADTWNAATSEQRCMRCAASLPRDKGAQS